MKLKTYVLLGILLCCSSTLYAQNGKVSGTIVDGETGEPLIGANVYVPELENGTVSDISGKYLLEVPVDTYTIEYSYVTYQKKVVEEVEIKENEVTNLEIVLDPEDMELQEVIVSAKRLDNNEVALLQLQKKSLSVQDGISSQEIRRIGFSNSAQAMKQVTGASLEGGKFIVMRGLGDRYSISLMDGVILPTTDPYKNSVGLDLIPTSMVDNLVVKKTFTPDLPGNFTGGSVNISTKTLPDQFYFSLNTSLGYNDQTTFSKSYAREKIGGKYDWLGYDDGSRALPAGFEDNAYLKQTNRYIIDIRSGNVDDQEVQDFNNTMRVFSERPFSLQSHTPGFNRSINVTLGNRLYIGENSLGYNVGLNYRRNFTQFDNREINSYTARIPDGSGSRMQGFQLSSGYESSEDISHGGILALAYQIKKTHEISFSAIYNNNTDRSVIDMTEGSFPGALSSGRYLNRVISFVERSLLNTQLKGEHQIGNSKINWSGNYIVSGQSEPDTRFIGSPVNPAGNYFFIREVQLPFHFFRDLTDTQYNGKMDIQLPVTETLEAKFGAFFTNKDRDFTERRYQLNTNSTRTTDEEYLSYGEASGDFDSFFAAENTGVIGYDDNRVIFGNTYTDQTRPENIYTGTERIMAGYLMGVWQVNEKLKTVAGARVEKTDFEVISSAVNSDTGSIDVIDILPSLNFIYTLNDRTNLRLSGSRTLARPNMREMAPFVSFDLLGGFPIVGNPDIDRTNITNTDLRYEVFPKAGELFAVSLFYKNFFNPIVLELNVATDQPQYEYINTRTGNLFGAEIEFRKNLDFITPALSDFKLSTNFTYTYSRVSLSEEEFEVRQRVDPDIEDFRPFVSQSPYIVNLLLGYENMNNGWEAALYANAFGPRLFANGSGAAPDVYEVFGRIKDKENNRITSNTPVPELNLRVQKSISDHLKLSLNVNNILDYSVVRYQEDAGIYFTTETFNPGRLYRLSLSYTVE